MEPVVLFTRGARACDLICWALPVRLSAEYLSTFPLCISTDGLFVHLELSDPTEHKDQKTLWGCFSSLKSVFSSHPIWAEVHGADQSGNGGAHVPEALEVSW